LPAQIASLYANMNLRLFWQISIHSFLGVIFPSFDQQVEQLLLEGLIIPSSLPFYHLSFLLVVV
jgi:hypothetical protein